MSKATSQYYPPRARWYSPCIYFFSTIARRMALDRIHLPTGISTLGLIIAFLVPGLGFYFRNRLWGKLAVVSCAALFFIFIIWLGYPIANFAFGLLMSIHVSGITYYCSPWLNGERLLTRILVAFLLTIALGILIYMPVRNGIQGHYFTPLRTDKGVVVVHKMAASAAQAKRGDTVAYNLTAFSDGNVNAHGGLTMAKILAIPGDHIEFSTNYFSVNGIHQPLLPHMPTGGEVIVQEKNWFIWPNLAIIGGHGNVPESTISGTMLQMAIVPQDNFVGKPFTRWFGRRQML